MSTSLLNKNVYKIDIREQDSPFIDTNRKKTAVGLFEQGDVCMHLKYPQMNNLVFLFLHFKCNKYSFSPK